MRMFRLIKPVYVSRNLWDTYIQLEPGNVICHIESNKRIGGFLYHTLLTKDGLVYSWFNIDAGLITEL